MKTSLVLLSALIVLVAALGCSTTGEPTSPDLDVQRDAGSSRQLWAAVDLSWDGVSQYMTVEPNRNLAAHFNVTQFLKGHIKVEVLSWDVVNRIMTVKVTIDNPLNLDGYDVRGTLFNLGAKKLLNPDDYTKIFDPNTPQVPNPFRAFAKDEPNRKFWGKYSTPEHHIKSETYEIYFPGPITISYLVDASYPGNCAEPYEIVDILQAGQLYEDGGAVTVTGQVDDWQDITADHVKILSNPITSGEVALTKTDATHWTGTITNDNGVGEGDYELWLEAWDAVDPNALYDKFTVHVNGLMPNDPPVIDSGVDGNANPLAESVETYTVLAHDNESDPLNYSWTVKDQSMAVVLSDPADTDGSFDVDWGALGVSPGDKFYVDCAVSDGHNPAVDADTRNITIAGLPGDWSDPIPVSVEAGADEILPRLVLRGNDYWVIYTDGSSVKARSSNDNGYTWSAASSIGSYAGVNRLHAVLGGDQGIYVQYQRSDTKNTYVTSYHDGTWSTPTGTTPGMGISSAPYSCDLGIGSDGYVYSLLGDYFSSFGWKSNNPWDTSAFTGGIITAFYDTVHSVNDGFAQNASVPRWFYVHDGTALDYGWYSGGWNKGTAMTGASSLIEPAIAPESDGPFHGVMGVSNGSLYDIVYFRFASWPPSSPHTVTLASGVTAVPTFHSISVEGSEVSVLYDADGAVNYVESLSGGDTFGAPILIGASDCAYSHIRRDPGRTTVVAAYAKKEGGDYNIYVRVRN